MTAGCGATNLETVVLLIGTFALVWISCLGSGYPNLCVILSSRCLGSITLASIN